MDDAADARELFVCLLTLVGNGCGQIRSDQTPEAGNIFRMGGAGCIAFAQLGRQVGRQSLASVRPSIHSLFLLLLLLFVLALAALEVRFMMSCEKRMRSRSTRRGRDGSSSRFSCRWLLSVITCVGRGGRGVVSGAVSLRGSWDPTNSNFEKTCPSLPARGRRAW